MRPTFVTLAASLLLLGGCSIGFGSNPDDQKATDAGKEACADVRAGVAAFNAQDYGSTIDRFREAIAPAEDFARLTDDREANDLLEAVRYYADLPEDEYADAFRTSKDFKRYQAITLGLCGNAQPEDSAPPAQEA